jgi:hypothetical protein
MGFADNDSTAVSCTESQGDPAVRDAGPNPVPPNPVPPNPVSDPDPVSPSIAIKITAAPGVATEFFWLLFW